MDELLKVLTDPVCNRILQMMRNRGQMTISDILSQHTNTPRATVYRKVEKMLTVGAIQIVGTNKVRGQTENIYAIKDIYISTNKNSEAAMQTVTVSLMRILDLFERYFQDENADVDRDKLFMINYAVSLSDKDFSEMVSRIISIVDEYQSKTNSVDAKTRNLYLMSVPKGDSNE